MRHIRAVAREIPVRLVCDRQGATHYNVDGVDITIPVYQFSEIHVWLATK
jgi:hypothetical protein